jgi:omega-amidase
MEMLRLGMLQYDPVWCDPVASRRRVEALLADAEPVDLLVLPEMSLTGFCMEAARAHLDDDHHAWFAELACRRDMGIVYGCVEQGSNRLVLLDRTGARRGSYDKRHLFGLGGEPSSYRPGTGLVDWTFEDWRIRPSICYDLRFSYHYGERAQDIDLAIVSACWPASRESHWRALLAARAIENQCFVAGVNRVGEEPQIRYQGASLLIDPNGEVVRDGGSEAGLLVARISRESVQRQRSRFPFLKDRL